LRVGGKYTDVWHRVHLVTPRAVVPSSIMPAYPWLADRAADDGSVQARMRALRALGHPYTDEQIEAAPEAVEGKTELDALIAYMQGLGRHAAAAAEHAGH
jgi:cytochrome c oxidase cbb3-type subunit 2